MRGQDEACTDLLCDSAWELIPCCIYTPINAFLSRIALPDYRTCRFVLRGWGETGTRSVQRIQQTYSTGTKYDGEGACEIWSCFCTADQCGKCTLALAPLCVRSRNAWYRLNRLNRNEKNLGCLSYVINRAFYTKVIQNLWYILQNEKNQIMKSNVWLRFVWMDYQLQWDEADYGGIGVLRLPPDKVWKPDIVLFNKYAENSFVYIANKLIVYHNRLDLLRFQRWR